ncbi:unnamed protein product [Miscanthus lutarioriparius]|uniref:Telomerase reverse transcriptase n=1 Tax=Miscanthus lutarioriparius TaxID=422564 RepID=A0A811MRM3_9POAL|nr:unnamed protein product [Miscanthus lutarioriparius]
MTRRRRRGGARGRVPRELQQAYGALARTLGHAVLSLLPPPQPADTPCSAACRGRGGAGCLACRRWGYLLRDGDPVAYRNLITRAVCAVAPAGSAPAPPRYTPGNAGHSQAKLVREMIKSIMAGRAWTTTNVLSSGCRAGGQTTCVSELVSSSSWDILLHRIGDLLMCYILRHSSIFLPVKKNGFFQVTGLPLNQKPMFASMSKNQQPQSTKGKYLCYLCHNPKMSQNISGGCVNNSKVAFSSPDTSTWKFDNPKSSGSYGSANFREPNCLIEGFNHSELPLTNGSMKCSSLDNQNPRKRKRLYSWQRHNKQKQICSEDRLSTGWSKINISRFGVHDVLLENLCATVNDKVQFLEPTVYNDSLAMSSDVTHSHTKEPYGVLSYEKSPSSVFDIGPSQCNSKSRIQSTFPQVGLPNFMHLNNGPICFNCLMLNSSKCVSVDLLISRHAIFYNRRTSYNVFHGNHILNKRKRPDALSLIIHIFGIKGCCAKLLKCDCHLSTTTNSNSSCLSLPKLMNKLIRNSKRCQYKKLLLKHCSVNSKRAADVAKNHNGKAQFLIGGKSPYYDQAYVQLEAYSTHQQVVSFIWAVLRRIIPEPLLGNSCGKRSLRINIWKFIKLRRFEKFCLSDCIGELKVSHYSWISNIGLSDCFCSALMEKEIWLSNGSYEEKLQNLLHCWISWMFSDIVIPLVKAYFYVTERESRRYDVFYYPKTVWRDLTSTAIASLNRQNFRILRGTSRKEARQSCCSSRVRFVPKAKDMRPLVNLRGQSKDVLLNNCHLIIKKVRDENPDKFGSSVFDYNNVHQNLWHFISSVRSHLKEKFKIYIVVANVSKAFNCIKHEMLLKVVDDALKCDDYVLRKCKKVVCNWSKNALYRFDSNVSISNGDDICDFLIQLSSRGGIFVDQGKFGKIQKKEIQCFLSKQVECNVLKIGQNFYSQQVGIIQGNKLSPKLCSLYFGHLENSELSKFLHDSKIDSEKDVSTPKSLLMRFIDDFIFISFSKEHALDFFNRIRRGFSDYNCYMNDKKYGFNFEVANSEHCCNRIYRADDGFCFIPWSGLLINCETLEIQADYTRYLDISSTITVKTHSSAKYLESKLCHYMRPKCHPIFFDSTINSPGTVRLNIYQAFLLCAMKFHCYFQSMPDASIRKLELLHIIKRTFRYMHNLIARRIHDVELQYNVRPVLKLRRKETMWLGLSAYLRVLQKKQSRYKDLLALLREEIRRCGHLDHHNDGLRYAVDDSHSSMFWKCKF